MALPDVAGAVLVGRDGEFGVVRFDCAPEERIDLRASEEVRDDPAACRE